jgi:hypothetical protein
MEALPLTFTTGWAGGIRVGQPGRATGSGAV